MKTIWKESKKLQDITDTTDQENKKIKAINAANQGTAPPQRLKRQGPIGLFGPENIQDRSPTENILTGLARGVPESVSGVVDAAGSAAYGLGLTKKSPQEAGIPPAMSLFERAGWPKSNNSVLERMFSAVSGDSPYNIASGFAGKTAMTAGGRLYEITREAINSAFSGYGASKAEQAGAGPVGQIGGAIIGGGVSSSALTALEATGRQASRLLPGDTRKNIVKDTLSTSLGQQLSNQDIPNIAKAHQFNQQIPGLQLRPADIAPGLFSIQRESLRKGGAQKFGDEQDRLTGNQQALEHQIARTRPTAIQDDRLGIDTAGDFARKHRAAAQELREQVADTVEGKVAKQADTQAVAAQAKVDAAQEKLNVKVADLETQFQVGHLNEITRSKSGAKILKQIEATSTALEESISKNLYSKINLNAPIETTPLKQAVEAMRTEALDVHLKTPTPAAIKAAKKGGVALKPQFHEKYFPLHEVGTILNFKPATSLKQLRGVRTSLLQERFAESRKPAPNPTRLANINHLRKAVNVAIHDSLNKSKAAGLGDPQAIDKILQADTAYADLMDRFERGIVGQVQRSGPRGEEFATTPGEVSKRFLDTKDDIDALSRALGPEQTEQLATEGLWAKALKFESDGKTLDASGIERVLKDRDTQEILQLFPNAEKQMQELLTTAKAVKSAKKAKLSQASSGEVRRRIQAGQAEAVARSYPEADSLALKALAGDNPEQAIGIIFSAGTEGAVRGFKSLRGAMSSDEPAWRGLNRGVWDYLIKKGGVTMGAADSGIMAANIPPDQFSKMLLENEKVFRSLYGDDAFEGLKMVSQAATLAEQGAKNANVTLDYTAPKGELKGKVSVIASRFLATARHQIGLPFIITEKGGRTAADFIDHFDDATSKAVIENLLFSPELLESLASMKRGRALLEFKSGWKRWARRNVRPAAVASVQAQNREAPQDDPAFRQ